MGGAGAAVAEGCRPGRPLVRPWRQLIDGIRFRVRTVVLPRRWIVERGLAWMMNARRHARNYGRLVQHSETLITWAAITLTTRRLAPKGATPGPPRNLASAGT